MTTSSTHSSNSSSTSSLSTSAAVIVDRLSMVFNSGRPNQVDALVDIELSIQPGDFVSLIGPSGCGKSTLLRLIANLIEPTSGNVLVNGKSAKQARLDQDYGMAFQQSGPVRLANRRARTSSCRSNSRAGTRPSGKQRAEEMLELVQLAGLRRRTCRGSCRAACSSASPSPGRSPRTRRCC